MRECFERVVSVGLSELFFQRVVQPFRCCGVGFVEDDSVAVHFEDDTSVAAGVGVACVVAIKSVFEATHGITEVAEAIGAGAIDVFARVMVVIGGAFDGVIRDREVLPVWRFDLQGVGRQRNLHAAAEKSPAGEGTERNDECDDGCGASAGNRAWHGRACGELATVVAVGIAHRRVGDGQDDDGENDHRSLACRQEGAGHGQQSASDPNLAAETMGGVPIFLIFQRPLDLDADGIILPHFWHNVAEHEDHQSK